MNKSTAHLAKMASLPEAPERNEAHSQAAK